MATKSDAKKSTVKKSAVKTTSKNVKKDVSVSNSKDSHRVFHTYMGTCRFLIVLSSFFLVSSVFFMVGYGFREETDAYQPVVIENIEEETQNEAQ